MKVEIWSDVVCPFCYIGKRKFEKAVESFQDKNNLEIIWRSFQLDPDVVSTPGLTVNEYLANRKGVTVAEGKRMNDSMSQIAAEVGLEYNLDNAIVTNTFNAHRLLHLAKLHGVQNILKENLFAAYYTQSQDIGNKETLIKLGIEVGLAAEEIKTVLLSDRFAEEVALDIYEASQIGVNGVPFFVFNDKYAVSGAQPTELFKEVLEKVYLEENPPITESDQASCSIDGSCN